MDRVILAFCLACFVLSFPLPLFCAFNCYLWHRSFCRRLSLGLLASLPRLTNVSLQISVQSCCTCLLVYCWSFTTTTTTARFADNCIRKWATLRRRKKEKAPTSLTSVIKFKYLPTLCRPICTQLRLTSCSLKREQDDHNTTLLFLFLNSTAFCLSKAVFLCLFWIFLTD